MSETVIEWSFAITLLVIAVSVPVNASAEETKIRVGAIDAVLTVPPDVERPACCTPDRRLRTDRP